MGLGHTGSSLGLPQKVQGGEMPEKGLEEGWTRSLGGKVTGGQALAPQADPRSQGLIG